MKRRLLHLFTALVCVVTQAMAMTGSGTAADPYLISSAADLVAFRDTYINNNANTAACAKLTADIDLSTVCGANVGTSGTNWHAIGITYPYAGTFDGDGHTVSNLYIKMTSSSNEAVGGGGLFDVVSGTVKNVKIKNPYISEDNPSGGPSAVGLCYTLNKGGLIDNCSVDGGTFSIVNSKYSGMICLNYGTIKNCINNSNYSGKGVILGGIVSYNESTGVVTSCVNNADMTFSSMSQQEYAGIVGHNDGIVEYCINNGKMYHLYTTSIAGIVNINNGTVRNCLSKGDFQSGATTITSIGAVVYSNSSTGTVTNCYYRDDIKVYQGTTPLTGKLNGCYENKNTSATPDTHSLTSAQCTSGEAAWLLNGSTASVTTWKQLLGTDANPSPLGTYTVYYANNTYSNYNTDASGTYLINNAGDLKLFADKVNATTANAGLNAKLMADIDLSSICGANVGTSGTNWTPIGNEAAGYTYNGTRYSGTFDGNGKTISGLYINNTSSSQNTLFYYVGTSAKVKNLTVDANINGKNNCAAIAAYNYGTISGCTAKGTIASMGYSGGIASVNRGTIEHCANEAKVTSSDNEKIGGITGDNYGTINYSVNSGIIENTGNYGTNTGGIAGNLNGGTISNSYNLSAVTSKGYVGGIVGQLWGGSVTNCYNTANVTSTGSMTDGSNTDASTTGAIVGNNNNGPITNCHYLSTLTLKKDNAATTLVGVGNNVNEAYTYKQTLADFNSGKIARLLNGGNGTTESATSAWGQNLATTGGDAYPVMMTDGNANAVYCASVNDVKTYCNTGKVITIPAATTSYVDEKIYTGDYKDASGTVVSGSSTVQTADMTLSQSVDDMANHKSNADSYYEISTAVQMKWLSYYVNASSDHAATNARLMADIDLSSACSATAGNWTPIGNSQTISYSGTFDGNGKAISNLYIANATTEYQGLFGFTDNSVIKNLSVSGNITSTTGYVGLLTSNSYSGQIIHCISSGSVSAAASWIGGIVGFCWGGNIEQCVNKATISSNSKHIGGIIGASSGGKIIDCLNEGTVQGNSNTGGILGCNNASSTINNCLNIGQVYVAGALTEDYPILGSDYTLLPTTLTNNYYLNTKGGTAVTNATAKTADELQTGTVARLLNGGDGTTENPLSVWGQKLGTDATPVFLAEDKSNAVYGVSANGKVIAYANANTTVSLPAYDKFTNEQINNGYSDGTNTYTTTYPVATSDVNLTLSAGDNMANHKVGSTYEITTAQQLAWLAYYVNAGNTSTNARLMNDISLATECGEGIGNWTPIGTNSNPFLGEFQGVNHTISDLYIKDAMTNYQGLFGALRDQAFVWGIHVKGIVDCPYANYVSLLAGACSINSYIEICTTAGSVIGHSSVGGIAGESLGPITDVCNTATVNGSEYVGGIVGRKSVDVTNCYNTADVTVNGVVKADNAIVGANDWGKVTNSYYLSSDATVTTLYGTRKTAAEFKSGLIARLLNGGDGTTENPLGSWGQNLATTGGDDYPVMMTDGNTNAVYNAKVYNGSSTVTAEGYMNLSYAAPTDNKMTVLADAGIDKSLLPANVITAENTARRIVITDGKDFYLPADVTADSASYSRSAFRDGFHETICIPFAPAALPADYNFSAYTSKDNGTAYFSTVTALNAGQAYMMKYTATANSEKADVTFENNGGNVTVLASPVSSDFIGSYTTVSSPASTCYILGVNNNKEEFRPASDKYHLKPFRAYLNIPSGAALMNISFDGEVTGINSATVNYENGAYYDLRGVRVMTPQKNRLYIRNGQKTIYKAADANN